MENAGGPGLEFAPEVGGDVKGSLQAWVQAGQERPSRRSANGSASARRAEMAATSVSGSAEARGCRLHREERTQRRSNRPRRRRDRGGLRGRQVPGRGRAEREGVALEFEDERGGKCLDAGSSPSGAGSRSEAESVNSRRSPQAGQAAVASRCGPNRRARRRSSRASRWPTGSALRAAGSRSGWAAARRSSARRGAEQAVPFSQTSRSREAEGSGGGAPAEAGRGPAPGPAGEAGEDGMAGKGSRRARPGGETPRGITGFRLPATGARAKRERIRWAVR